MIQCTIFFFQKHLFDFLLLFHRSVLTVSDRQQHAGQLKKPHCFLDHRLQWKTKTEASLLRKTQEAFLQCPSVLLGSTEEVRMEKLCVLWRRKEKWPVSPVRNHKYRVPLPSASVSDVTGENWLCHNGLSRR